MVIDTTTDMVMTCGYGLVVMDMAMTCGYEDGYGGGYADMCMEMWLWTCGHAHGYVHDVVIEMWLWRCRYARGDARPAGVSRGRPARVSRARLY
eukprot:3105742-Heterocapsa_arctica.AAC.1